MLEEGLPRAYLGFTCTLHDDCEERGKGGEEREDAGEEGLVWLGRGVDFFVEDVVEEDLEGVGEVGEVRVVVGEVEGRGGVVLADVVAEYWGEE